MGVTTPAGESGANNSKHVNYEAVTQ